MSNKVLTEMHSMTKEEQFKEVIRVEDALEDLVEANDILSTTTMEHLYTLQETVQIYHHM